MTAKELIEKLQTVDPDLVVLGNGYEGGYYEIVFNKDVRNFNRNVNIEWYYGTHDEAPEGSEGDFKGIVL